MKKQHQRTLVLNADHTAMGLVSWQQAVSLQWKNNVALVSFYKDDAIKCINGQEWPLPAVVALKKYQKPKRKKVPFSRKNIFIRDRLICQYCNKRFDYQNLTLDHVIPRSKWTGKGTPTCWNNIVSCCSPCNTKKADNTLQESGMKLYRLPVELTTYGYISGFAPWTKIQPEWVPYVSNKYKEILEVDN